MENFNCWSKIFITDMVSFENFVKLMLPSLLELKITPSFCFAFKIPDNVTVTRLYMVIGKRLGKQVGLGKLVVKLG